MSLWKIAWRSIQQRSLASTLTAVSMALGVGLIVAVMVVSHVVENYFKTGAGLGYNLVVGKKGSSLQLVLNTVYYLDRPIENIPWSYYKEFLSAAKRSDREDGKFAAWIDKAVPVNLGDYYSGFRVVGTTAELFDSLELTPGQPFEFTAGENFPADDFFTAVIGATVAQQTGLGVGDTFSPSHAADDGHIHEEQFRITGILKRTGSPIDRALYVNIEGFYLLAGHAMEESPTRPGLSGARKHDHDHAHSHDHGEAKKSDANDDHKHDHDHPSGDGKKSQATDEDHQHIHDHDVKPDAKSESHDREHESKKATGKEHADHDHDLAHEPQAANKTTAKHNHDHDHADDSKNSATTSKAEHDHKHDGKAHAHEHADAAKPHSLEKAAHGHDHAGHKHDHVHAAGQKHEHAHDHKHAHNHDHGHGHDHSHHHHDHTPLPEEQREVTAILVLTKSVAGLPPEATAQSIIKPINKDVVAQAVQPIYVITQFLASFLSPLRALLLGLTVLIVVISGISILVSIYNSMAERRHEIAVMRALGAGRTTVMLIMLLESVLLALAGGLVGWGISHAILGVLTPWLTQWTGATFQAFHFTKAELWLIPGIIVLASLVGFLPAWSAYRTDVAKALTANP